MKKKLLLMALLAFVSFGSYAQADAFPVSDISQCGNEVFDLTVQTPFVLGSQNPDNFTVEYFLSWEDADANQNAIANPQTFIINPWPEQALYIRVTNNLDDSYDITSFVISIGMAPFLPDFEDVTTCGAWQVPLLNEGIVYTEPGGTGDIVTPGMMVTSSTTLYVYAENPCGSDEASFEVTITEGPAIMPLNPLSVCDENGDGVAIFDIEMYLDGMMDIYPGVTQISVFETYTDAVSEENMVMNLAAYANMVPSVQTVYVRFDSAECVSIMPLQLVVTMCETENTISGTVVYDDEGDGCDENDMPAVGAMVYYVNGNFYNYTYTDSEGNYTFYNVPNFTITVFVDTYYPIITDATPDFMMVDMPANAEDINFCLTAPEPVDDVSVFITPTSAAQPGFPATYALIYQNLGTSSASGEVTLEFDDDLLDFVSASPSMTQAGNTLTFSYTDLPAYQAGYIYLEFTVALPPTVEMDDILAFTANITPLEGDDFPENNNYVLEQVSTNSWDPNDIRCHEGESITEAQADGYLYYTIRFQNKGTMAATTVRIEDTLSPLLDVATFDPLASSHNFQVNRSGSDLTFVFNNINLDYEANNEEASQGYVTYKVKPVSTIALGDDIDAQANIYFDFDPEGVPTPLYTTTVENTAGIEDTALNSFVMYPNPASETVNIELNDTAVNGFTVTITDVLGKTVLRSDFAGSRGVANVESLNSGVYFITAIADGKPSTRKLIRK